MFWRASRELTICAKQVPFGDDSFGNVATAEVAICDGENALFFDKIPWAMPAAECTLLMQVYLLSQMPDYKHAKWQQALKEFCYAFPDFSPPDKLWWGNDGFFD